MREIEAYRGQSVVDVAVMACGSADYAHEVAKANGLAEDAVLEQGRMMKVPIVAKRVEREMAANDVVPVSGERWMRDGVGALGIGIDFVVG